MPLWPQVWRCSFPRCEFSASRLWRQRAYLHAWVSHGVWPWRWFEAIGMRLPHPFYEEDKYGYRFRVLSGWWWAP